MTLEQRVERCLKDLPARKDPKHKHQTLTNAEGSFPHSSSLLRDTPYLRAKGSSLNYPMLMDFEWDEKRRDTCFRDRGFDFAYDAAAFADLNRMIKTDTSVCYGEPRYLLTGSIEGRLYVLVNTPWNDRSRIISARKANLREIKKHEERKNEASLR